MSGYMRALISALLLLAFVVLGSPTAQDGKRHIPWWLWLLLPIALIVWVVWWWLQEAQEEQDRHYEIPIPGPVSPSPEMPESELPTRSVEIPLSTPAEPAGEIGGERTSTLRSPDDLTVIEGIGPKIQRMLNEHGIYTFEDLAAADPEELRPIFRAAKLYFVDPTTWPEQARLAAEGRWEELKALQDRLIAGRREGA